MVVNSTFLGAQDEQLFSAIGLLDRYAAASSTPIAAGPGAFALVLAAMLIALKVSGFKPPGVVAKVGVKHELNIDQTWLWSGIDLPKNRKKCYQSNIRYLQINNCFKTVQANCFTTFQEGLGTGAEVGGGSLRLFPALERRAQGRAEHPAEAVPVEGFQGFFGHGFNGFIG